jgi:general secretion pathway protein A
MSLHLDHFGLTAEPFSKEIGDKDLWLPPSKQHVVDELVEAIEARESVSLTGESGVGKTCVLRATRARVAPDRFRLTYCHNATLGRRDFYRQLSFALGLRSSATAAAVFFSVSSHVEEIAETRVHPVFVLDEAHLLHQDVLDHLHILLNYAWDSRALLSLILVGLSELDVILRIRRNRSLASRLHRRLEIDATTPEDTLDYLRFRLRLAGVDRDLFPEDAVALLHEAAQGTLRELDRVATTCLRHAARKKRKTVDREVVSRVLKASARA